MLVIVFVFINFHARFILLIMITAACVHLVLFAAVKGSYAFLSCISDVIAFVMYR